MHTSIPYKLSICVEADGFSFVLSQDEAKTILKRQVRCNKNELASKLIQELQLQNLSEKPFGKVEVVLHSPISQLVPQELYRKEDEAHWLQVSKVDDQQITSDRIDYYGCYNIYAVDKKLYQTLIDILPEHTIFKHSITNLIQQTTHEDTSIKVFQGNKYMDMVIVQNGKLLLGNTIAIENDADAAYWILNSIERLDLSVKQQAIDLQSEFSTSLRNILNDLLP